VFTAARRLLRNLRRIASGHVGRWRVLAILQRPNVSDDRPSIARRNLSPVVRHHPEAVGDDVIEVADVGLPQPVDVVRRRLTGEAALNHHAVAATGFVVTRAAVNVVALLPAVHERVVNRNREFLHRRFVDLSGEERFVVLQRPARDGALDEWPRARAISEERARPQPAILRLVVHVLTACSERGAECEDKRRFRRDWRLATGDWRLV
jgi:hypothetical protein